MKNSSKPVFGLPDGGKKIDSHKYALMEFYGHLSLIHNVSNTQIEIWILEDFYRRAWFKKHNILAEVTMYTISNDSSSCSKYENGFSRS